MIVPKGDSFHATRAGPDSGARIWCGLGTLDGQSALIAAGRPCRDSPRPRLLEVPCHAWVRSGPTAEGQGAQARAYHVRTVVSTLPGKGEVRVVCGEKRKLGKIVGAAEAVEGVGDIGPLLVLTFCINSTRA